MKKAPKGTTRGVFVVDKQGKVLASEPGSPTATVEVVRKLVGEKAGELPSKGEVEQAEKKEDEEMAETADEVADSAAKVDA